MLSTEYFIRYQSVSAGVETRACFGLAKAWFIWLCSLHRQENNVSGRVTYHRRSCHQ